MHYTLYDLKIERTKGQNLQVHYHLFQTSYIFYTNHSVFQELQRCVHTSINHHSCFHSTTGFEFITTCYCQYEFRSVVRAISWVIILVDM